MFTHIPLLPLRKNQVSRSYISLDSAVERGSPLLWKHTDLYTTRTQKEHCNKVHLIMHNNALV